MNSTHTTMIGPSVGVPAFQRVGRNGESALFESRLLASYCSVVPVGFGKNESSSQLQWRIGFCSSILICLLSFFWILRLASHSLAKDLFCILYRSSTTMLYVLMRAPPPFQVQSLCCCIEVPTQQVGRSLTALYSSRDT